MKKCFSAVLAGAMAFTTLVPFSAGAESDQELWDRFLKYDLCITDYDSLTAEQKELCRYIFETETSCPDTVICKRARMQLAGKDVGADVDLDLLKKYRFVSSKDLIFGMGPIFDSGIAYYSENAFPFIDSVPDLIYADHYYNKSEAWYTVYFLNDEKTEYITSIPNDYSLFYSSSEVNMLELPEEEINCPLFETGDLDCRILPDGNAVLVKYTGANTKVDIPDHVGQRALVGIEPGAFMDSDVEEVTIPDSVKYIAGGAFTDCKALTAVHFPKTLEFLGGGAFFRCDSLGDISIDCPDLQIRKAAFYECSLNSLSLNIRKVPSYIAWDSTIADRITLGGDVGNIGIAYLLPEQKAVIPETVSIVTADYIFGIRDELKAIRVPEHIQIFGAYPEPVGGDGTNSLQTFEPIRPVIDDLVAVPADCVIECAEGSEAHLYAQAHGLKFRLIGDETTGNGDANCDGAVTIADAAAVLQYLSNADKYGLTEDGKVNADCDGDAGISTKDAYQIQLLAVKKAG